jgi:5-methyltetrahydropteroyltriglutamate--homocysteine methyltransferase
VARPVAASPALARGASRGYERRMQRSVGRILTTHAGSLPRPPALVELFVKKSRHEPYDAAALATAIEDATRRVVREQLASGIDVGNDGEPQRESFFTHLQHRMRGFSGGWDRPLMRDLLRYPGFLQHKLPDFSRTMVSLLHTPQATAAVEYVDNAAVEREADLYRAVLAEQSPGFTESYMTAPSPGIVACAMENRHYKRFEDYVAALAEALRHEYQAIVAQGFVLQIDAPDLAMERHTRFADRPIEEFLDFVDLVIHSLNRARARIPPEQVRLPVCWGNYAGPHHCDVPLENIIGEVLKANVATIYPEGANPRHEHEWEVFKDVDLPDGMAVIIGCIDTKSNYVEHPKVVANRITRLANVIGKENVLAGTDCGFDTFIRFSQVDPDVAWLKLRALADGAELASDALY